MDVAAQLQFPHLQQVIAPAVVEAALTEDQAEQELTEDQAELELTEDQVELELTEDQAELVLTEDQVAQAILLQNHQESW